jgi:hypothetical protein
MGIRYRTEAFFMSTIVHFLFPAHAVITTEEHQMHDPFKTDQKLIEENAFLNQGIKEQEPSEAESTQAGEAPEPGYCRAAGASGVATNRLRSMNIFEKA